VTAVSALEDESIRAGVTRGTVFQSLLVSAPDAPCNRTNRRPRAPTRSGPGSAGGHARPEPGSTRSTSPNKAAPPAEGSGNSTPPPSGPSGRRKAWPASCFGRTRPRQSSLRPKFCSRLLPKGRLRSRVLFEPLPDIAYGSILPRHVNRAGYSTIGAGVWLAAVNPGNCNVARVGKSLPTRTRSLYWQGL
jgi:hypothetical protein